MKDHDVEVVTSGLAPKLDVFLSGSTDVNRGRAEQSPSVAVRRDEQDGPAPVLDVELLSRNQVAKLAASRPHRPPPPSVGFSLFVQLDRDLDPERRRATMEAIGAQADRVRWKIDTASVEASADKVRTLLSVPGVAYVEPGQTLRGPEPTVGSSTPAPANETRRVATQVRRHHDGRDVLVGIIDVGGFDFAHPDFLRRDGGTRWVAIWDQGGSIAPPPASDRPDDRNALGYGSEILQAHMDAAIAAAPSRNMAATSLEPQSQMAVGSHGTHVASIAAGNRGVARRAHLAGVLIELRPEDTAAASSFYDSTRIADAVDYLLDLAASLGGAEPLPVSINISLGTNGHAHDTSSAMARWIDNALATRGRCVSVAAGNAGQVEPTSETDLSFVLGRIHAGGTFKATNLRHELGWIVVGDQIEDVSENELEIWYSPQDRINVEVRPPGGAWIGPVEPGHRQRNVMLSNGTVLSIYSETYYPANGLNRISILLSPVLRTGDRTMPGDRADRRRRVARPPDRHDDPGRALRRLDRTRRPPAAARKREAVELPVVLRCGQLHAGPHDQLPGLLRADPLGGQHRRGAQRGQRHVLPRADAGRPLQAGHRGRRDATSSPPGASIGGLPGWR